MSDKGETDKYIWIGFGRELGSSRKNTSDNIKGEPSFSNST